MVFLVRGIFMIFCGITYPLAVLPDWMKQIALFLPLTYAIQDIRAAVLAEATFGELAADLQKLPLFAIIMPLLGWAPFYLTERRARRMGTLGQH